MFRILLRNVFLTALLAICCTSQGVEWVYEDTGVSFQLPEDPAWRQVKPPRAEAKLVLQRNDTNASVVFIAFAKKPGREVLNEEFVHRWENGYYRKPGNEKLSGEFFTFKGRRAYKATSEATRDNDKTKRATILWFEDYRLFEIAATKHDAEPLQDKVIKEFIDSIKFG